MRQGTFQPESVHFFGIVGEPSFGGFVEARGHGEGGCGYSLDIVVVGGWRLEVGAKAEADPISAAVIATHIVCVN